MLSSTSATKFPIWYRQPFKSTYVTLRIIALVALLPYWTAYYSVSRRPRASWTLKESVVVRLIHWLMPLNAKCGLSPLCTDKTRAVPQGELKETTFVWLAPADSSLIRGPAKEGKEVPMRIPGYIWPRGGDLGKSGGLVGLFIHGGGYMMGNGTESFMELSKSIIQNCCLGGSPSTFLLILLLLCQLSFVSYARCVNPLFGSFDDATSIFQISGLKNFLCTSDPIINPSSRS